MTLDTLGIGRPNFRSTERCQSPAARFFRAHSLAEVQSQRTISTTSDSFRITTTRSKIRPTTRNGSIAASAAQAARLFLSAAHRILAIFRPRSDASRIFLKV
jgi:hypothetical protein